MMDWQFAANIVLLCALDRGTGSLCSFLPRIQTQLYHWVWNVVSMFLLSQYSDSVSENAEMHFYFTSCRDGQSS